MNQRKIKRKLKENEYIEGGDIKDKSNRWKPERKRKNVYWNVENEIRKKTDVK